MLKRSLAGEAATTVLAGRVQLSLSLTEPASLQGASFEAPRGNTLTLTLPLPLPLPLPLTLTLTLTLLPTTTPWRAAACRGAHSTA